MDLLSKSVIAALSAVTVLSCTSELIPDQEPETSVELRFTSEMPVSKTLWDGSGILWSAGDMISVTYTKDGVWASEFYTSEALEQGGEVAEFMVPVGADAVSGKNIRFHAIYPSSALSGDFSGAPEVTVIIPSEQTPAADSFDPSADLMVARAVELISASSSEPIPLLWNRLVAHADITLTLPVLSSGEKIQSVTLAADEQAKLVGSYTLDIDKRTLVPEETGTQANVVTIKADNLEVSDGKIRVWAALVPCHVSSFIVKLHTDQATYIREIPSCDVTFKPNVRGVMSVDMTSAVRKNLPDPAKNALINSRLFEVIDIQADGMSDVRSLYEEGYVYEAAQELKNYYAGRTDVSVPLVNLSSTSYTPSQERIAEQALKDNGYRFYIAKNYIESTSSEGDVYYSFLDTDGGVNWDLRPTTDEMFVQQMHRHPWIETQALVYWGTKDEKYAQSIVDVYSDWLKTFPCPVAGKDSYYMGMEHADYRKWCNLQACARIDAYIKAIQYCKGSEAFTPEFLSDLLVSLYDCVECIRANYYYEVSSNIRQSETQAVLNMAVMMPEYRKAGEWLEEALTDTEMLLGGLLGEDGVLVEKDVHYHIGVLSKFYDAYQILSANNKQNLLLADYFERLKKGVLFVRDVMYPDYSMEDFNDTRSSSWTQNVLRKNFVKYAEMFPDDQTLQWFATLRASGSAPTELLSLYKTSGWYMFRTGWEKSDMMLILKNNENSAGYAHCQNDNGTISLYRNGRHFLPDAGVYTYGGSAEDDAQRAEFRKTKMHNTLTYKGANSVNNSKETCGVFKKSAQTDVYDMVHTSNQSYGALRHERHVYRIKEGFFVIVDQALGSATGSVELNWHLCPGTMDYIRQSDSYEARTTFGDGNDMSFRTFCFDGTTLNTGFSVTTGTSWHSNVPGTKYERPCYTVSSNKSGDPVRFITVIYPFANASAVPNISVMFNSVSLATVTVGDDEYVLTL